MPLAEELVALQKQGPSNVGAYVKIRVDLAFFLEQYDGALVPDELVNLAFFHVGFSGYFGLETDQTLLSPHARIAVDVMARAFD